MNLLVSELRRFQIARCKDKKTHVINLHVIEYYSRLLTTYFPEQESVLHFVFAHFQKQKLLLTHEGRPHVAAV